MQGTDGVIFVIDTNDRERMGEAREDLNRLLQEDEIRNAALLVLANKQDLPNAMSVSEVTEALGLSSISVSERQWYIQAACATTGDGLYEGLDWLCNAVRQFRSGKFVPRRVTPVATKGVQNAAAAPALGAVPAKA